MDKVSIIIPCYNSGKVLDRAVSSAQNQTWKNCEVIIVNDGSNDKVTLNLLSKMKGVKVINQSNQGLSSARNKGIENANGNFLLFLDSDDYVRSDAVEIMINKVKNFEFSYAFCDIQLRGKKTGSRIKYYNFFEQLFINHIPYFILIKKDIMKQIGAYDTNMKYGYEDWELNIRLAKNGFFPVRVEETLFFYNVSFNGMLNSVSKTKHMQIFNYIKKKHEDIYNFKKIILVYLKWRKEKMNYNIITYVIIWILSSVLPSEIYNKVYNSAYKFKQKLF